MNAKNWYTIDNVQEVDTPFLAIYPDRVKANIDALKAIIPDASRLRPHVKVHKSKQVVAMMMEAGITKFKCATIAEAEMLALAGAPDVLLAYQPVGPKIKRLIHLIAGYPSTKFACLVDNEQVASGLAADASERNLCVSVYLDLNVGMNRTGILPASAIALYRRIMGIRGVVLVGLHAYAGQITQADPESRHAASAIAYDIVARLRAEINQAGFPFPAISSGSTPTLQPDEGTRDTEWSPGTFIYWDQTYAELYKELPFDVAALVVTRVISMPSENQLCLDLGYKAISSEGDLEHRVRFLGHSDLRVTSQSEEHMVISAMPGHQLVIGDVLYGLPYHIGRTCNLYQSASIVYNNSVNGEWYHFTGRKIST
jgi:D-serine deaminase-like pyridoxal phosphate-dependent protein